MENNKEIIDLCKYIAPVLEDIEISCSPDEGFDGETMWTVTIDDNTRDKLINYNIRMKKLLGTINET